MAGSETPSIRHSPLRAALLLMALVVAADAQVTRDRYAAARSEYRSRRAAIATSDTSALVALAQWCRERKLYGEMRAVAGQVVAAAPDHPDARALLGHVELGGRWLTRNQAMLERGYVRYRGQWRTLDRYAEMRAGEARQLRLRRVRQRVEGLVRRMSSRSPAVRDQARDDLLSYARRESLDGLADAVTRLHSDLTAYWERVRAEAAVTVDVRLNRAYLARMRRFAASLGTGRPVTLELPELRRASIGTTVLVPVR